MNLQRILDANWNRAAEGARVVEDFARFILHDAHLCRSYKQLRHDLAAAVTKLGGASWWRSRDSVDDAGAEVSTPAERHRVDAAGVWMASQKRLEQALRCLEEYGKTISPAAGADLEQLRYRAYQLGRALSCTEHNQQRLREARVYVLVNGAGLEQEFAARCRQYFLAGADVLQLRDKTLSDRDLLSRASLLAAQATETGKLAIINDRADIALLSNADGVHLGQEDLAPGAARRLLGPQRLIGVSAHNLDQARQAVLNGADYLGLGPAFHSQTKEFPPAQLVGPDFVRAAAEEIRLPAFAIGGIDLQSLDQILETGVHGVAVCGAVATASDPLGVLTQLQTRLSQRTSTAGHSGI